MKRLLLWLFFGDELKDIYLRIDGITRLHHFDYRQLRERMDHIEEAVAHIASGRKLHITESTSVADHVQEIEIQAAPKSTPKPVTSVRKSKKA